MRRIKHRVWLSSFVTLLSVGLSFWPVGPAQAALVSGCHKIACVDVFTGGKNTTAKTQWVDQVNVYSMGGSGLIEAWGDGFYYRTNGNSGSWNVKKWVRSGTYVCGAVTVPNVPRRIACIAIRV